jgi:hypothetical protein
VALGEKSRRFDPPTSRHAYVHQHELGRKGISRGQRVLAARCFAHYREAWRRVHEIAEHAAKELLVVYNQYPDIGAVAGDGLFAFLG